jgi:hypothetical protein
MIDRRLHAAFAVAVVIAAAAPAAAEDPKKQADRHFKNGVELYNEAKYAEALAEFERAYSLAPHPFVLYNLAGSHRALSHYEEAVHFYNRFLTEGPGIVDKKTLAKGKSELAELTKIIATVEVETAPGDAELFIDGKPRGQGTAPVILGPGEHTFVARKAGYKEASKTLRLASGDEQRVALALEPLPPDPPDPVPDPVPLPDPGPDVGPTPVIVAPPPARRRVFGVGATFGVNAMAAGDTGAPTVGLMIAPTSRLERGVVVVLVAYAAVPSARLRLAGSKLSVHAVAAVPVAFTDGGQSGTFAALAGGLGARYRATPGLSLRLEGLVAWAGADHGTTVPVFAGGELWF